MGADRSAYAALGLDPGADDASIEQAYRRLIKQYHPDRSGGDAERATEINRAYRELRGGRDVREPLDLNDDSLAPPREGRAWVLLAMVLAAACLFLVLETGPTAPWASPTDRPDRPAMPSRPAGPGPMEQGLSVGDIDRAAGQAARLRQTGDEMTLAVASRDCHQALRRAPTVAAFDRCASFDAAAVQLLDRDPLRDRGPFSEIAVTGRMRSAAALLSDDSVAIDARLQRIRTRVEAALSETG